MSIAEKMKELLKDSFVNRYFQSVGRNSIVYVCLNQIVIQLCSSVLHKGVKSFGVSANNDLLITVLILILTLAILFLLSLLFEKTIMRVLVGHFNIIRHKKCE